MTCAAREYYNSLFGQIEDEGEFDRLLERASRKLDMVTHMRAKRFEKNYSEETATDFQKQVHAQIRDMVCELINVMIVQEASGMGMGISSVSNQNRRACHRPK